MLNSPWNIEQAGVSIYPCPEPVQHTHHVLDLHILQVMILLYPLASCLPWGKVSLYSLLLSSTAVLPDHGGAMVLFQHLLSGCVEET